MVRTCSSFNLISEFFFTGCKPRFGTLQSAALVTWETNSIFKYCIRRALTTGAPRQSNTGRERAPKRRKGNRREKKTMFTNLGLFSRRCAKYSMTFRSPKSFILAQTMRTVRAWRLTHLCPNTTWQLNTKVRQPEKKHMYCAWRRIF